MIKNFNQNKNKGIFYIFGTIIIISAISKFFKFGDNGDDDKPTYIPPGPNMDTITPSFNIQDLRQWIDKKIYAKFNGVKMRTLAKSNAPIARQYNTNQHIGYVFSAVSENLGTKQKVWFLVMDNLNGAIVGYVPMDDVSLRPINGHFID